MPLVDVHAWVISRHLSSAAHAHLASGHPSGRGAGCDIQCVLASLLLLLLLLLVVVMMMLLAGDRRGAAVEGPLGRLQGDFYLVFDGTLGHHR